MFEIREMSPNLYLTLHTFVMRWFSQQCPCDVRAWCWETLLLYDAAVIVIDMIQTPH